MIKKLLFKGVKNGIYLLAITVVLLAFSGAAFAVTDRTWLVNASSGQVASGDNCRYIVYYKGDDLYIQTEDSWNAVPGYANTNAGYVLSGSPVKGYCQTDSTYYPDPDPAVSDPYDIWISSIADLQAGHASGQVDDVPLGSPSYVPTGNSNGAPFALAGANYLAEPGSFKASAGNGRVLVSWNAVAGATGYKVYRGPVSGVGVGTGIYQRIADTNNIYYEDASVTNGTTYYYIVYAYNATKRGVHTNQIAAIPDAISPSITPPLSPATGTPGVTDVTISGSGFLSPQGTGFVLFNGVPAVTYTGWIAGNIVVRVPPGTTTGPVYVVNSAGKASNGVVFTVAGGPAFSSINPLSGNQGATLIGVQIVGSNTNFVNGTTTVTLGSGITVSNVSVSDATHLTCNLAISTIATIGFRNVVVTTGGETVTGTNAFSVTSSGGGGGISQHRYEKDGGIMDAYPNPFNPLDKANLPGDPKGLQLLFGADAAGEAIDVYLFDANGRVIWKTANSQPGTDRVSTWEGYNAWGAIADNGYYMVRVAKANKLIAKGKILVIKQ